MHLRRGGDVELELAGDEREPERGAAPAARGVAEGELLRGGSDVGARAVRVDGEELEEDLLAHVAWKVGVGYGGA